MGSETEPHEQPTTRRELLARAGAGVAAALGALAFDRQGEPEPEVDRTMPSVAVVGAGLAGLTCAFRLHEAGIAADVYESSARVGGRVRTVRDAPPGGLAVESGGELVDDAHLHAAWLAADLGLELEELSPPAGTRELLFVAGEPYPVEEALVDLAGVEAEPEDGSSVEDWIAEHVPGGSASRLGRLLTAACRLEYGADPSVQSAANLRYLLDRARGQPRGLTPWPGTQRIAGGNDELATRLTVELGSHVHTGSELVALELAPEGAGYVLTLRQPDGDTWSVEADRAVLAVPCWSLRSVDCARAGFEPLKLRAIDELGTGTHAKLHLAFAARHWHDLGCDGRTLSDEGSAATWDATSGGDDAGVLAAVGEASPEELLRGLERLLPGISARWSGEACAEVWSCSRAFHRVGQAGWAEVLAEPQGHCHFAGEHTSSDFPGTMEGAIESGERAAAEILGDIL